MIIDRGGRVHTGWMLDGDPPSSTCTLAAASSGTGLGLTPRRGGRVCVCRERSADRKTLK